MDPDALHASGEYMYTCKMRTLMLYTHQSNTSISVTNVDLDALPHSSGFVK